MSANYPVLAMFGWVALVLGTALLGGSRERRLAAAGLLCLGLGLAAWRASSDDATGPLVSPAGLGEGFLVVNGGLLILGVGLVLRAASSGRSGPRSVVAILAIVLGAILVARLSAGLLLAAGIVRVVASAVGLGLAGAILVMAWRTIAFTGPARTFRHRFFSEPLRPVPPVPPVPPVHPGGAGSVAAILACATAVAFGPHVAVVFLGVIVAAWSAHVLFHSRVGRPAPVTPSLTLLLVPTYWLLATISGPEGLRIAALPRVPLSPAAEWLVAAALLLVGWSVAGLWPLHRQMPGALTGPLGVLLLLRIALPLAPAGLEYWRPLAVPVLIVGLWHAAALARWPLLALGAASLGVAGLTPVGATGAKWLMGSALVLELSSMIRLPAEAIRVVQVATWVPAAWGGLLVLEGSLRGEVVYTALGAVGTALLVAASDRLRPSPVRGLR